MCISHLILYWLLPRYFVLFFLWICVCGDWWCTDVCQCVYDVHLHAYWSNIVHLLISWNEMILRDFMNNIISYLFANFSQFLENQGFLASVSSDNEIQVPYVLAYNSFWVFHMRSFKLSMTRHPLNMCNNFCSKICFWYLKIFRNSVLVP